MSTKTLRKRIALVAVSALTAGVLSVVATPSANATALANTVYAPGAAGNPLACSISTSSGVDTVVLPLGADLDIAASANMEATDSVKFLTPGLSIVSFTAGVANRTDTLNSARTSLTVVAASGQTPAHPTSVKVRAAAVGSYAVTIQEDDAGGAASFADIEAISVTWVSSCGNNVYDAAKSLIQVRDDNSNAGTTTSVDEPTGLVRSNSETAYIALDLKDAYNVQLSGAGSLIATATNGAVVNWDSAPSIQTSTAYLGTRGVAGTELYVVQGDANEDKPVTTSVTISLDGVTIATKSIRFLGAASKIVVSDVTIGKVSGTNGYFSAVVQDSAGNNLYQKTVENDATANAATLSATVASVATSSISQDVVGSGAKPTAAGAGNNSQVGRFSCASSGSTTLAVKHVTNSVTGAAIKATFPVGCSTGLDTWTISLDKATYAPGEIATLTLAGKDSKGNPVNTTDTISTVEYSFGGMTFVTAPTSVDTFNSIAGGKQYKLSVGTSEGAFVGTFKISGATDTSAKTVQYKVANSTTTVTNADVLKSIVSLIASINKQIQALQKLILRR